MILKTIIISIIVLVFIILTVLLYFHFRKKSDISATPIDFNNTSTWQELKKRPQGVNDTVWSARMLDSILGHPAGTTSLENGSATYNARLLSGLQNLTKTKADHLCQNPCYWYGKRAEGTGMCKCDSSNFRSVNF